MKIKNSSDSLLDQTSMCQLRPINLFSVTLSGKKKIFTSSDIVFIVFSILSADIDDSKLIEGTEVINSTFTHNKTGCQMTFDDDYSAYWVYFINFLGTLAVLPGNIVSALLMDKIGRLSMLGRKEKKGIYSHVYSL